MGEVQETLELACISYNKLVHSKWENLLIELLFYNEWLQILSDCVIKMFHYKEKKIPLS